MPLWKADPRRLIWIALEHCRFLRASADWDLALWDPFRRGALMASELGILGRAIVRCITAFLLWQRRVRRGRER